MKGPMARGPVMRGLQCTTDGYCGGVLPMRGPIVRGPVMTGPAGVTVRGPCDAMESLLPGWVQR